MCETLGPNLTIYHITGCKLNQTDLKKLTSINLIIIGADVKQSVEIILLIILLITLL